MRSKQTSLERKYSFVSNITIRYCGSYHICHFNKFPNFFKKLKDIFAKFGFHVDIIPKPQTTLISIEMTKNPKFRNEARNCIFESNFNL